ncbi:glucosaminidase domain-containing protein [Bacillus sp. FJAT-42376]|uniref:glucosaminidase domain-containing protein n=1 Tax=Bacillus sp. FJAT-42376 TaxID=2014076 RepID=UPI0013DDEE51|nr:glucosaminidase domain-containing protein [Bacillus sp. FJAT-42376]
MENFIDLVVPYVIKLQKEEHIAASLLIAQSILETGWGESFLAKNALNLFGIKGSYKGQSITVRTIEYVQGEERVVSSAFKRYPSWYESFKDLVEFYKRGTRYAPLFGEMDYKKACLALQQAGYASDPNYASKLIGIIERNGLAKYDTMSSPPPASVTKPYPGELIKKGSKGMPVLDIQKQLNKLNFKLAEDGIFGMKTERTVRTFQQIKGLSADGVVGVKTWNVLFAN